ncbi:MAG TPA: hypothetical protein VJX70_13655 [Candidatus Acidoferrum sp.]|nr:hypothetical protein [Candidatus Acidoferrum sp.]
MSHSRLAAFFVVSAFLWIPCRGVAAQKGDRSSTNIQREVVSLSFANSGQRVATKVGQQIEISLGAMAPCDPQISSGAIRLESVSLGWPPTPGIATHTYIFEAVGEGKAEVKVPITDCSNPDVPGGLKFSITIRVKRAGSGRSTIYATRTPDQTNAARWKGAWTNLLNDADQTFTPSLPRLTGIEVELVVGNPGPSEEDLTLYLRNAGGEVLASVSKTVPAADCNHVLFVFPKGGLQVSPGQAYNLRLSGGSLFGWKYVVGGYANGAALFNGKLLLPDARSTFLFRTFGAN